MAKAKMSEAETSTLITDADLPLLGVPGPDNRQMRPRGRLLTPNLISLGKTPELDIEIISCMERRPMPNIAKEADGCVPCMCVRNITSGEVGMLILPSVLISVLGQMPEYIGKKLHIESRGIHPGKSYRDVQVWEIE